jgi:DNA polymerase elongation subunit (family B)
MSNTKRKISVSKPFRLFDFNIYDDYINFADSNSSGTDEEPKQKATRQFIIQMFGINEIGETCCIYVNDYNPYFYIKVPDNWTNEEALQLKIELVKICGFHGKSILEVFIENHQKLYGFTGGKQYTFVKINFKNMAAMNSVKNLWYGENSNKERIRKPFKFRGVVLETYESNIPPLLRYFHINNISPSGWIQISTQKTKIPTQKTTTCNFEYICSLNHIKPILNKETQVPYKICSFDIEASSSHGDFPIPIKSYKKLATNIVDIYIKHKPNTKEKVEQLFKNIINTAFGYERFEDVDIVYPKTKPSKEALSKLIQTALSRKSKPTTNDEINKILTIDTIFSNKTNIVENGDGGDGEAEEESLTPFYKPKPKTSPPKSHTLFDTLLGENIGTIRDQLIELSNELLTNIFPRLEGDKVTFIGSTFIKYGEPKPYMNHCLVLGSCDPIEGAIIETTETECELLLKWTELIQIENPDIIIGYNIFGFDYEFMFRRSQENHCEKEFLSISRKVGEVCAKMNNTATVPEWDIENTKVVLASGEYDLRFYKTTGRLQIDMYAYLRKDFNLPSYKLDDVASQFISDDIKYIETKTHPELGDITELYSKNLTGLNVGDSIHIEISSFTSDYFMDGKKFKILDINYDCEKNGKKYNVIIIDKHYSTLPIGEISKTIKWGMAKDDVTPQDIFRLSLGTSSDRAIVAKYCIQDCNLVHHLMNKIDVITGYIEMSRICSVPISFLVFRGQGIKLTSFVAKKCREKNTLMPDIEKSKDNDGYEGAIVLPPKCSMYMDNPVACVDYASLYPSSMISNNLSHDSKVWTKEYDLENNLIRETGEKQNGIYIYDNLETYQYVDTEYDTFKYIRKTPTSRAEKVKCGTKICRWVQLPNNQKSIMPSILEELLHARQSTRNQIKSEKDPFMQNILDKRQLGYKATANSLYGQCGAKTSTFYEKDVAASTTATGRLMIIYAKRMVEEVYGNRKYETKCHGPVLTNAEYVYGDTDSVFFTFNLKDNETGEPIRGPKALEITIEIAQDVAKLCTDFLKPPMELTYEKTLMPFILLSKKRYVGVLYKQNITDGSLKYMGLSLKRRDSCDYLKDVYGTILNILMGGENPIQSSTQFLEEALQNLLKNKVPFEKLMITRALRSDYKNPNQIAHKVLAERIGKRDPGNKPKPGDRIKFLFICHPKSNALLGERIETPDFIIENKLKIDTTYYITNQLMKPLQQLFGLCLEQIWEYQGKFGAIKEYKKTMLILEKEYDLETFMKKKEKYCSEKIKVLLFDKIINSIANIKNGMKCITDFYK